MREIKFRAWDKQLKKMLYQDNYFTNYIDNLYWWFVDDIDDRDKIILMQYTGLHDKAGKEIYCSDLVKIYCHKECKKATGKIGWFNDRWWIFTNRNSKGKEGEYKVALGEYAQSIDYEGKYSSIKVIGNIYENSASYANAQLIASAPELLEACKKALQFINNGVEMGYITLPDKDDSALLTRPMLKQAIAKAEGRTR